MAYVTDPSKDYDPVFGDYIALLKPRVMSLVVFTAFVGLLAAPGALHPIETFCAVLFIALGAGASGSLDASNMFKPALARGEVQCIGATTLNEYRPVSYTHLTLPTNREV
mgnify:CR=1 FL=1